MSNNLLTISKITNEALMVLENELKFTSGVTRQYEDQFAVAGAKIGNTVNVRRPARFVGTSGPNLNVEDFYESSVPVVLGQPSSYGDQFHVDVTFTTQDLALSLDMFSDRVIRPAVAAVANHVDRDGTTMAANNTANIVGTPGTAPNQLLTYLTAQAYLDAEAAPRPNRSVCIEPFTQVAIVDALKGLLQDGAKIGEQYNSGMMGRAIGLDWMMDQNIVSHTYGSWATTAGTLTADTTATFTTSGWASSTTLTLTASQTMTLKKGDKIQIANVFAVNPQNRQAYGANKPRWFTVNADVTGTSLSVNVSPAIITAGQFQNVVVASTSATATVTPFSLATGTANAVVGPMNIMYHRNAFTMACADLELPEGVHFAGRAASKEAGLSIRVVRQYTINNDSIPTRFDILYGWAPLYPELACVVAS